MFLKEETPYVMTERANVSYIGTGCCITGQRNVVDILLVML